jgi:hypothetical protein
MPPTLAAASVIARACCHIQARGLGQCYRSHPIYASLGYGGSGCRRWQAIRSGKRAWTSVSQQPDQRMMHLINHDALGLIKPKLRSKARSASFLCEGQPMIAGPPLLSIGLCWPSACHPLKTRRDSLAIQRHSSENATQQRPLRYAHNLRYQEVMREALSKVAHPPSCNRRGALFTSCARHHPASAA